MDARPVYEIYETPTFTREFQKIIPKQLQTDIRRRIITLKENPYGHGKPLGEPRFRELRAKGFRIYYVIQDATVTVILAGASDKKSQRAIIARVFLEYRGKH